MLKNLLVFSLISILSAVAFAQNKSVYRPLTTDKCQIKLSSPTAGSMNGLCPGIGGFNLQIADDDARMSVTVVAPNQELYDLNFWGHFGNFSSIGEQSEWRLNGKTPIGLIIRYNVWDKGDTKPPTSYLMVSKITPTESCVIGVVKPAKNQNLLARRMADSGSNKPCKTVE